MLLECYELPWDFELLDTGGGYRLERWGQVILTRPDPQIIWARSLSENEWRKAWAVYQSPADNKPGRWKIKKTVPQPWTISWQNSQFLLKLSPFKHTGIFHEQAAQWSWMTSKLKVKSEKLKVLNLFAYTGGATVILAKAGCQVTHVDASKPALNWANENAKLNNLPKDSVRWILDDAVKFVKREIKRGANYDGIIMDPPAFGHAPDGKTWRFNNDLPGLLANCVQLLSDGAKFLIINGYATNSSAIAINNLLEDAIGSRAGKIEFGELCLKHPIPQGYGAKKNNPDAKVRTGRLISTGIFSRWHN